MYDMKCMVVEPLEQVQSWSHNASLSSSCINPWARCLQAIHFQERTSASTTVDTAEAKVHIGATKISRHAFVPDAAHSEVEEAEHVCMCHVYLMEALSSRPN